MLSSGCMPRKMIVIRELRSVWLFMFLGAPRADVKLLNRLLIVAVRRVSDKDPCTF